MKAQNKFFSILIALVLLTTVFLPNFVWADNAPVLDTTAPIITLNGESTITLTVGDTYNELGATAIDETDGILFPSIQASAVSTTVAGIYTVGYLVSDAAGNQGSASRTVIVNEPSAPPQLPTTVTISAPENSSQVSGEVTITASTSGDPQIAGVKFYVNEILVGTEDTEAPYSVIWNTTELPDCGNYSLTAVARDSANNFTTSSAVVVNKTLIAPTSNGGNVTLKIRNGSTILYSGEVALPQTPVLVTDNNNVSCNVAAESVLGTLTTLDSLNDSFSISKTTYYSSFDSFLIDCITDGSNENCNNWHFVVNGQYSEKGVDHYILKTGDQVYLYFGDQTRFNVSSSTIEVENYLEIFAEQYDFENNVYIPRGGVTASSIVPFSWPAVVTGSTTTDSITGKANLLMSATGTYSVGIFEDFYYPTIDVTVTEKATTENTNNNSSNSGNTGGSGSSPTPTPAPSFNVTTAAEYLDSQQKSTGAIGSATLYSDWAAMAIGSLGNSEAKTNLVTYLKTDPGAGSLTTDYERRAMALLALGINPYSDTKTNYIGKITATFDGTQFGDAGLVNDDIFALLPLLKSGYNINDPEIKKTTAFILSKQNSDGSWESPDLTAAAIQALSEVKSLPGVEEALTKAKNYLKLKTKTDGRIGDNTFSTSWSLQALSALGESAASWNGTSASPLSYLATEQQSDGGVGATSINVDTRVWSTSYAIPGVQGKTWSSIMTSVSKPSTAVTIPITPGTDNIVTSTPTVTTSTPAAPTTTPIIVTTTLEITAPSSTPEIIPEIITVITPPTTEPIIASETVVPVSIPVVIKNKIQTASTELKNTKTNTLDSSNLNTVAADSELNALPPATPVSQSRALFGSAAALASSAGAYLTWRFLQGLA